MRFADSTELRVLVLAPLGRDAALVEGTLHEAGLGCLVCPNLEVLRIEMAEGAGAIVVTEDVLGARAVAELGELLAGQLPWSDLPLLIFSSGREERAGSLEQLKKLTSFTLLDRPTRKITLISAVQAAIRARRRQYEVRDLVVELETSVRSRDQFLAMLSHELRNPLAAILTAAQVMERRDPAASATERGIVQRQARLLARLVDDLLDVSRVTLGKIALSNGLVDMGALLERCVKSWTAAASDLGVDLALAPPPPFFVEGDSVRLEQIVSNLLSNAVKYTPRGGHVAVSVEVDGDMGRIRVADDGVGIDADSLPRIFELFSQDDQTLDRSRGGLGVGLTLVRSLVGLHGGTVSAASEGRGRGSQFVVTLPRVGASAAAELPKPAEEPGLAAAPMTILLIDDNADLRTGLSELLKTAGHEVLVSGNGETGICIAVERRPDSVLVDIGLPGLDGYAVARKLRAELGQSVRLVALTGYGSADDRRRSLEAGFDEHITKPTTFSVLSRVLSAPSPPAASHASRGGGASAAALK
jgi:two-component system, sensor histidine kinase